MVKKLFSLGLIEKIKKDKSDLDKRIKRLEATLDGERSWMLEQKKAGKTIHLECKEIE